MGKGISPILFGHVGREFPSHPRFNEKYLCEGQDEREVRRILNDEVLTFIEQIGDYTIEGSGDLMMVYPFVEDAGDVYLRSRGQARQGKIANHRVPPEQLAGFVEKSLAAYAVLRDASQNALEASG